MKDITQVRESDVALVYSGKPGCGCGCLGKYWTQPRWLKVANIRRGYAYDLDECSLRQVRRILKIMQTRFSEVKTQEHAEQIIYSLEDDARYFWLFIFTSKKVEALRELVQDLKHAQRAATKVSYLLPCQAISCTIESLTLKAEGYEIQLNAEIEMLEEG